MSTPTTGSAIPPPGGDKTTTPIGVQGAPLATGIVWSNDRWIPASADQWLDLPGAVVPAQIGPGSPGWGGTFIATFTAETLCQAADSSVAHGLMALDIFFGGQQVGHPISDNHRFTSSIAIDNEWRARTTIRVARFNPAAVLTSVDAQVRVRFVACDLPNCGLQNWLLKVERFA